MKAIKFIFILIILQILLLTSCAPAKKNTFSEYGKSTKVNDIENLKDEDEVSDTDNEQINKKTNIEEIRKNYSSDQEIIGISNYTDKYALVEYRLKGNTNLFDFYNLESGDRDQLTNSLLSSKFSLIKIVNENEIVFFASGQSIEGSYWIFPSIINFIREKESIKSNSDFIAKYEPYYASIGEELRFGSKTDAFISDLKTNTNGVEVFFKPKPGKEGAFYAGYTNIPPAKTNYINEKDQIVFEFDMTDLDVKFISNNKILIAENSYFDSLELKQENENSKVIFNLKEITKEYTVIVKHLPNGLPYANIVFR